MSENAALLTDEQLVLSARRGDGESVELLLNRYKNLVRTRAKAMYIAGAESDDLIQEGMIGLFKAIRDFDEEKNVSFSAFALLCVRRQMITALKSATRMKHMPLNSYVSLNKLIYEEDNERTLMDTLENADTAGNPEEMLLREQDRSDIRSTMDRILSRMEMEVLAQYLDGRSYVQIAQKMGKDVKSVDNALQRIKKKVEKYLKTHTETTIR